MSKLYERLGSMRVGQGAILASDDEPIATDVKDFTHWKHIASDES
ncbi:MAG: hypothetical protein ABIV63_18005 [Caldimonas sp.]